MQEMQQYIVDKVINQRNFGLNGYIDLYRYLRIRTPMIASIRYGIQLSITPLSITTELLTLAAEKRHHWLKVITSNVTDCFLRQYVHSSQSSEALFPTIGRLIAS